MVTPTAASPATIKRAICSGECDPMEKKPLCGRYVIQPALARQDLIIGRWSLDFSLGEYRPGAPNHHKRAARSLYDIERASPKRHDRRHESAGRTPPVHPAH